MSDQTASLPLVSVIIPCWNAEKYVLTAVLSALSQTYPNVEIVVVDDGSKDGSVKALDRVRDRIKLVSTENRGAHAARNAGLELSSGAFIKFLDADDFLFPEAIERQLQAIEQLGDREFTVGRLFELEEATGVILPASGANAANDPSSSLECLIVETPITSCMLYRRSMVEAVDGFRDLPMREDFDFFVRLVFAGFIPREDGVPVYVYRNHASPDRLTRRKSAEDYRAMAGMYEFYLQILEDRRDAVDPDLLRGLGKSAWITGRDALRAEYSAEAALLFELARRFDPNGCVVGSGSYVATVRMLGPRFAEAIGRMRG